MAARAPLPPFPRWTGAHVTLGMPKHTSTNADGRRMLHVPLTVHITRRARLWAAWRAVLDRADDEQEVSPDGTA
ncbi:hypothetical protein [Streptomyces sp. NPDC102370]|uniref:hypothetical protein n=1 Tax=Streptomyces sp. NPDC102370 TaxID=3366163 RepID=UPI0038109769